MSGPLTTRARGVMEIKKKVHTHPHKPGFTKTRPAVSWVRFFFLTPPDMTAHQVASYRLVALSAPRIRFRNSQGPPSHDFPVNQSRARLTFCMISITRHTQGWLLLRLDPRGSPCDQGWVFFSQAPTQPPTGARKSAGHILFGTSWRNSMLRHTCQLYEFAPVVKLGSGPWRLAGPPGIAAGSLTAGMKTETPICGPQFYARDPPTSRSRLGPVRPR